MYFDLKKRYIIINYYFNQNFSLHDFPKILFPQLYFYSLIKILKSTYKKENEIIDNFLALQTYFQIFYTFQRIFIFSIFLYYLVIYKVLQNRIIR